MHTILHIGAGAANELAQWLETGAKRVVLVEPNPILAEQLRQRTADMPEVTVVEAAVTTNTANNHLQEYNLLEASSLHPATGLKTLFPGLKTTATHAVTTISPEQLLAQHGVEAGEAALLVIQAPGEEHAIIQALIKANRLKQFSDLSIRTNPEPYYQGSVAAAQILQDLAEYGYEIKQENQQDPDWPTWHLARNPLKDQIDTLRTENDALKEQLAESEEYYKEARQRHKEAEEAKEAAEQKVVSAMQEAEQLHICLKEWEAQHQQVRDEHQNELKAKNARLEELEVSLNQHQEQIQQGKRRQAETEKKLEQHKAEAAQELSEIEKRLLETEQKLNHAENAFSAKAQAEQQVRKQLEQLRQQLSEKDHHISELEKHRAESEQQLIQQHQAKYLQVEEKHQNELKAKNIRLDELELQLKQYEGLIEKNKQQQETRKLVEQKLEEELQQKQVIEQQLQEEKRRHQETQKSLEDNKLWFQKRKQQAEQLQAELADLKQKNDHLEKELIKVETKLEERETADTRFNQLEEKLSGFGNSFNNQLDKKLINAAKQIENTLGLQSYLSTGELPLSYHGWPISPDLALYLTEKLETENYDLVIEFGSGTSTVLFAKVMMKKMLRQRVAGSQKRLSNQKSNSQNQEWIEEALLPDSADLPKRVLTFEHNKDYHEQTAGMLRQAGLDQVVNLVFAPLVDYNYQGENYLYYDCDKELRKVAELYQGREPRILVLVDGPPGATGPNARFPALPKLLNYLSTATFEVILDDYNRKEEKAIAEKWIELIKKRSASYTETKIPLEKGAVSISIGVSAN
ncbi:MAG: hypothetical protein ACQEV6_08245 [Pseudomonadota bacterium]